MLSTKSKTVKAKGVGPSTNLVVIL